MSKYITSIDTILQRLGYIHSSNLIFYRDINRNKNLSIHTQKILEQIKPYAVYIVNNKPFVLFFEDNCGSEVFRSTSKIVWNAQIPISIFCNEDRIKVFNGLSLNPDTFHLCKILEEYVETCSEDMPFSYFNVTDEQFWIKYIKNYSESRLSDVLLENIKYITEKLKRHYHIKFATKLVLRIIFIRYLIDRGVDLNYKGFSNDIEKSKDELQKVLRDKEKTYKLFVYLKKKFHGNLFDIEDEFNDCLLTEDVLALLADFVSAEEHMVYRQKSFFKLYDFNIISVELISNIYEILLGRDVQTEDNAFYTPNHLVDYILSETISKHLQDKNSFTILDPSCGSGIFLVDSYRRMIEKKLKGASYSEDDELLVDSLKDNIYGIDINDEAIDVAIFSLYVTMLDYKDPKTLKAFILPNLKNNLIVSDFFDDNKLLKLKKIEFDFIIGNPPWGDVKTGFHIQYCEKTEYAENHNKCEISQAFVFRAKDFSCKKTEICFVLHSKLLYNQKQPSKNFRKYLLQETKIKKIIELSSVRKILFKHASAPAIVLLFKYYEDVCFDNQIVYISLKPSIFFKLFNVLMIEQNDIKKINQKLFLEYDWLWKTVVFGFSGDFDNILQLKKRYATVKSVIKNLVIGNGVQDHDGDKKDSSHLIGLKILDSNDGIDHFHINTSSLSVFNKNKIHRPRNQKLFEPPYCITSKGLDCFDYTMRSAYSEEKFICRDTMYIIKGNFEEKEILLNITGLFNSTFYSYLNLMLGSSVGIEREQRFMDEVEKFPYIFDKAISEKVKNIINLKNGNNFGVEDEIKDDIDELNMMILNKFGLTNNVFVDYAINVQIPQLLGQYEKIYHTVSQNDLKKYAKCFFEYFSSVYKDLNKFVHIDIYPNIAMRYTVFQLSILNKRLKDNVTIINTMPDFNKSILSKFSIFKITDLFFQTKTISFFGENSFTIVKSNYYKNWHPAIARLDLNSVIDDIFFDEME